MQERLQKIISTAGIASRRAAEELILEGRVRVNGKVVTELGSKADPGKDHIKVDGKLINPRQPKVYLMLNKPEGYVTTLSDPEGRQTVQNLLRGVKARVYPVGRLDYNTEGLLLFTNDGDFAHLIMHPSHELPKTYLVKIKGVLSDEAVSRLETGVFLKDGKTAPARVKRLRKEEANSWVEITIHEGRKRQVRRMIDHVGNSVIRLKRVRVGNLPLGNIPPGTYRHLTPDEVKMLKDLAEGKIRETREEKATPGPAAGGRGPGNVERREAAAGRGKIFAARGNRATAGPGGGSRGPGNSRGRRDFGETSAKSAESFRRAAAGGRETGRGREKRTAAGPGAGGRGPGSSRTRRDFGKTSTKSAESFSRTAAGGRGRERREAGYDRKPGAERQRSIERKTKPAGRPQRPLR